MPAPRRVHTDYPKLCDQPEYRCQQKHDARARDGPEQGFDEPAPGDFANDNPNIFDPVQGA